MIDYLEGLGLQEDQNHLLALGLQVCLLHPENGNETMKGQRSDFKYCSGIFKISASDVLSHGMMLEINLILV